MRQRIAVRLLGDEKMGHGATSRPGRVNQG